MVFFASGLILYHLSVPEALPSGRYVTGIVILCSRVTCSMAGFSSEPPSKTTKARRPLSAWLSVSFWIWPTKLADLPTSSLMNARTTGLDPFAHM